MDHSGNVALPHSPTPKLTHSLVTSHYALTTNH